MSQSYAENQAQDRDQQDFEGREGNEAAEGSARDEVEDSTNLAPIGDRRGDVPPCVARDSECLSRGVTELGLEPGDLEIPFRAAATAHGFEAGVACFACALKER